MCCYRDIKNFDRFHLIVQSMICLALVQSKNIEKLVIEHNNELTNLTSKSEQSQSSQQSQNADTTNQSSHSDEKASDVNENVGELESVEVSANEEAKVESSNESETEVKKVESVDTTESKEGETKVEKKDEEDEKFADSQKAVNEKECKEKSDENEASISDELNRTENSITEKTDETTISDTVAVSVATDPSKSDEIWTLAEFEKLLMLISKAFLLNFPLYIAYKHAVHARLDDISAQDVQNLSTFCDLQENEMPIHLLRNVSLFCTTHGFAHLSACFDVVNLPLSTAHAITAVVSNLKLWLNFRSIVTLFVPIRSKILQYMRQLADQDLRSPATKSMADFMWTAIKDNNPLETQITFDADGLALAFKYFTSSTLTMRLAGMAQINTQINMFNDICTSETVAEVEMVGQKLSDWLNENKIINHLFGPNLHVELIKQSTTVLRFLAVENQITEEHLNLIWQAAQLKHCSKAIYDVLPSLVKNLSLQPALYMYKLLCRLDPKEHTEQSIFIASTLIKLIWSRDGSRQQIIDMPGSAALMTSTNAGSSSENSVSVDGSNSEEEHPEEDSSDGQKSTIDIEGGSDSGPTPCKQARHKNCCDEVIEGKLKTNKQNRTKLKFNFTRISLCSRKQ